MPVPYVEAPREYFTHFRRSGGGIHKILQSFYPEFAVRVKETSFSWAQSLYLTNILASSGLVGTNQFDVADIGSRIPRMGEELYKDGINAVSIDPNKNLVQLVEALHTHHPFISSETTAIPLPDKSVTLASSHTYIQKLPSAEDARRTIREMMRIATDYVVVQPIPSDSQWFKSDDAHTLSLSAQQWHNTLTDIVQGTDWQIKDVHKVRIGEAIPVGRPPVFVLERGYHQKQHRDFSGMRRSTRMALAAEEEATFANLISLSRPPIAAYVLHEFENVGQSLSIGAVMLLDAVDGMVARKLGPSPAGKHVDRMADHAVAGVSYFMLGYPVIGGINAARDAIVDAISFKVDESATNRQTKWSRYGYGILKGATFMTAPISYTAGHVLALASTAFSLYRALDLRTAFHRKKPGQIEKLI